MSMSATVAPARSVTLPVRAERAKPSSYRDPATGERMTSIRRVVDETRPQYGVPEWAADAALNWTLANTALVIDLSREDFARYARIEADNARNRPGDVGAYVRQLVVTVARSLMDNADAPDLPPMPAHLAGTSMDGVDVEDYVARAVSEFLQFVADQRPVFKAVNQAVFNRRVGEHGVAGTVDLVAYLPDLDVTACIKVTTAMRLGGKGVELAALRRCRLAIRDDQVVRAVEADASAIWHMPPAFTGGYRLTVVPDGKDAANWQRFLGDHKAFLEHNQGRSDAGRLVQPLDRDGRPRPPLLEHLYDQGWGAALAPLRNAGCRTVADVAQLVRAGERIPKVGPVLGPVVADMVATYTPDSVAA